MNQIESHPIKIIGILSMKPNLEPLDITHRFSNSINESRFKLHYNSFYDKDLIHITGDIHLESSCIVEYEDHLQDIPDTKNASKHLIIEMLVKINKIIDIVRYTNDINYPNSKLLIRNVGIDDFLFIRLDIDGKFKKKFFKETFTKDYSTNYCIEAVEHVVPFEWATFMKAIDLLDFGFYNESLIIGFNLLDYCAQKTIKSLMVNLKNEREKEGLLRQIKEQRLKTFLGPLFKALTGISLYDSLFTVDSIEELNTLRNKVVHSGKDCNYQDVCRSLKTIHRAITEMSLKGPQRFIIPDRIILYGE